MMTKYDAIKKTLKNRLDEIENSKEAEAIFETTELSNYDNHPADNASDLTDQHTRLALIRHFDNEKEEVQQALEAIENGTYGTCRVCNKTIPIERLEAKPTALTCVEHAEQEVNDARPVEEEVLNSSTDHPIDRENDERRDFDNSFDDVESFGSSDTPQDKG